MESKLLTKKYFLYATEFFAGMSVMAVELGASRLMAPYFSSSQIRLSSHIQKLSLTVNFSRPSWQLSSRYRLVSHSQLSADEFHISDPARCCLPSASVTLWAENLGTTARRSRAALEALLFSLERCDLTAALHYSLSERCRL